MCVCDPVSQRWGRMSSLSSNCPFQTPAGGMLASNLELRRLHEATTSPFPLSCHAAVGAVSLIHRLEKTVKHEGGISALL